MKNCNKCDDNINCGCAVKDLSTDCSILGADLDCSAVEKGSSLTQALVKLDQTICDKFEDLGGSGEIVNIGTGQGVYKDVNNQGQKELKSLKNSSSIDVTQSADEIIFSINEDWAKANVGEGRENIVEFDKVTPTTSGVVFTPNTPFDEDALFWSNVNNSTWKYNGTTYVTAPSNPNQTPFLLQGTTNDAGGNKSANIIREGSIGIGVTEINPQTKLDVEGQIRQTHIDAVMKSDNQGILTPAIPNVDYLTPTGSAQNLTNFPTLNQNTTGNAATVTTIPALTGDVSNTGNNVILNNTSVVAGSYTSANITVNSKGQITAASNGGGARPLKDFYADAQNNGTTPTDLYTYTIPANTLSNNGDKIRFEFGGIVNNPTNSKTITLTIGTNSTSVFNSTTNGRFRIEGTIIRKSNTTLVYNYNKDITFGSIDAGVAEITVTGWNSPQNIILSATGTISGDVVAKMGTISFEPAAP